MALPMPRAAPVTCATVMMSLLGGVKGVVGSDGRVDEEFHLSSGAELLEALLEDAAHRDGVDPAGGVVVALGHQGDDGAVVVAGVADGALDAALSEDEVDQRRRERLARRSRR